MASKAQRRGHPLGWQGPFPLPSDTVAFVTRHCKEAENFGLWLDRFASWEDETKKKQEGIQVRLDVNLRLTRDASHRKVPMLKGKDTLIWQSTDGFIKALQERWRKMLNCYPYHREFTVFPAWRFVVGLGGASVLDTGITLHRLYGIPIIPGSALKGLARAYAETVEGKEANDPNVVAVFGKPPRSTPLESGEIIFFDAIPITQPRFKLDVMTSHFPKYYQENGPPADWQDPKPIYFLTVQDTEFLFAVAARRAESKDYVNIALNWLKQGLATLGIGAKTAAGYGFFEEMS